MRLNDLRDYTSSHDINQRTASSAKAEVKAAYPSSFVIRVGSQYVVYDKEDGQPIGKGTTPDTAWASVKPVEQAPPAQPTKKPEADVYYVKKGFTLPVEQGTLILNHANKLRIVRVDGDKVVFQRVSDGAYGELDQKKFNQLTVKGKDQFVEYLRTKNK